MSVPDMRHCVQYALSHPHRCEATTEQLDLFSIAKLTFAKPDPDTFILLSKAFEAIEKGGALPAILNASNEEAVAAFLNKKIRFCDIPAVVCQTLDKFGFASNVCDLEGILEVSKQSRIIAQEYVGKLAM
jgi:1-deoxy-D-xylulose-5-phosphate reductoisomerase